MHKNFKLFLPVLLLLAGLGIALVLLTLLVDPFLFFLAAILALAVFGVAAYMLRRIERKSGAVLEEIADSVRHSMTDSFIQAPMPVITVYDGGEIIWYNQACIDQIFLSNDMRGKMISEVMPGLPVAENSGAEGVDIRYGERAYTAFVATTVRGSAPVSIIYLLDDTTLKYYTEEYRQTLLSVALISVDNYDEMAQDYKESERAELISRIEAHIERYIADNHGFVVRTERNQFMALVQERGMKQIVQHKFDLLDKIREIGVGDRMTPTLSIGVGHGAQSLAEANAMARQALDMSLGRGGDQAAVKNPNGYDFYGGVSKAIERRTKIKTRIIASAIHELIENASNVIVMGHRFADLDALGAAVGVLAAVKATGKPAVICIDATKNLVVPLMERLREGGYPEETFASPQEALARVEANTLLIIVDTHVARVVESKEVYEACKNVVVIDHHRKLVGYIENAVVFYHEPYASSTAEMVAELLQYFPQKPQVGRLEAEALLAGIMLDTKNFVMRTGVRTFETAAYLRRLGADTVDVRKLFASSLDSYVKRNSLIANAEIYHRCAIAASAEAFDDIRVTAAQAADELMNISGVDAAFVIFMQGDEVNVSARSMGTLNVQVLMESLGGGGHRTMAAAQFPGDSVENVRERVMQTVDDYHAALAAPAAQPEPAKEPAPVRQQ